MFKARQAIVLFVALLTLLPLGATAATVPSLAVPVTGTITSGATGTFHGVFHIAKFALQNNTVYAVGTITGELSNTTTGATSGVNDSVSVPLTPSTSGSCSILHLDIGPINLDLLGLVVTTNEIVLDISAQPGPGNLLGNLLCAIANLLNSPSQLLISLLNQIISILGAL